MSQKKPVVAIAGATGNLGNYIARAFLEQPVLDSWSNVILFTRDTNSEESKKLEELGADLVTIDLEAGASDLTKLFEGVDVFISTIGPGKNGEGHKSKLALMSAAADAGVKVYIPSEFGIDHREIDFEHEEWNAKKVHQQKARATSMKVVALYPSLFLEDSFGPWFGLDTKNNRWEVVSSADALVSFTSKEDVAKAVTSLAVLAIANPINVPDHVRIGGDTLSISEAKKLMEAESNRKIELIELNFKQFKSDVIQQHQKTGEPSHFLRFLMGAGDLNHSKDCSNELVNPNQQYWKWKTVANYAKETKGLPWC